MEDFMRQATEWREKATEYWNKAKMANDYDIHERFAELAARYLDMAQNVEDRLVASSIASASPKRRHHPEPKTST
ncbi:MAG TPA: hypothetical protein VN823_05080 [Stellaceae bacterium]|nr:hypothetical protein [Stellaceae bacterium]